MPNRHWAGTTPSPATQLTDGSSAFGSFSRGWCPGTESNCRHGDFQSPALPAELPGRPGHDAVPRERSYIKASRSCPVGSSVRAPMSPQNSRFSRRGVTPLRSRPGGRRRRRPDRPRRRCSMRHRTSARDRHRGSGASRMDESRLQSACRRSGTGGVRFPLRRRACRFGVHHCSWSHPFSTESRCAAAWTGRTRRVRS